MTTLCHVRATSHLAKVVAIDVVGDGSGDFTFVTGEIRDVEVGQEVDVYAADGRAFLVIEPHGTIAHELMSGLEQADTLLAEVRDSLDLEDDEQKTKWDVLERACRLASLLSVVPEPAQPREAPPPVPDPIVPAPSS